jgi:purine-nucleoside phosphorylase
MAWSDHPERLFDEAAAHVTARGVGKPDLAIILGSGLGSLADEITDAVVIPFADIPGFPVGAVSGHRKALVFGGLEGRKVLVYAGRSHSYEGGDAAVMKVPLGLLTRLGSPPLLATNAAGSVNLAMKPGDVVAISDHISLGGPNPLTGDNDERRFVPMADAYSPTLRARLRVAASSIGLALDEGVYMWWTGPSFETPAEIRLSQRVGADLVGMSTVPEVIMARRLGLTVAGLSIVTNYGTGMQVIAPNHMETKHVADTAAPRLKALVRAFVKEMAHA